MLTPAFFLPMAILTLFNTIVTAVCLLFIIYIRYAPTRPPLPPGPYRWPIVGNMFNVPTTFQWKKYLEWSKTYNSDIIHLNVVGTSIIVLCSAEATDELLLKRSSTYSDRPRMPMFKELMGWAFAFAVMKYGPVWRAHRKLFQATFDPIPSLTFRPTQLGVAHNLLRRLLQDRGNNVMEHLRLITGETILSVTYGIDVLPNNDPYIALAEEAMRTVGIGTSAGKFVVDAIPMLKHVPDWFPGAGFKIQAKEWSKLARASVNMPFAEAQRKIATGTAQPSFISQHLQGQDADKDKEDAVKDVAGTLYIAASDTTLAALGTFCLAMLANPKSQRRAQKEIDDITGLTRLPNFDDEKYTLYMSALIKEVLRWHTVVPLAIPHFTQVEDVYRGYRIPAGSIILGNSWAISHDETLYPDSYAFKPERFLLDSEPNLDVRAPDFAFGFGRRVCPGRHMAMSSMWITIASILSTFDITKAVGDDGNVIEPTYEFYTGIVSLPRPFKCSITPRSKQAMELIQATAQS
ncbi:cytochrome P450 [Mycena rebaudengoi]|nr:cytochrome P450 [Mycena rebaudengoi]